MPFIGNAGQFANIYEKNYTTTTLRVVEGDAAYQAYNPADSHYKLITNLQEISNIGASTNRTVTFSNVNTGFTTSSNVGIANTQPIHTMDIGSKVHIDENDSNTFWTSGSLYADELKGETAVITNSVSVRDVLVDRVYPKTNGYIYSTSNVGIITSNPSYTLDVDGDINFTGTLYENGVAFSGGGGGGGGIDTTQTLVLTNAITGLTVSSNAVVAGNVTASVFLGDGGLLSNIESQRVYTLAVNGSSDYIFQGPGFDNPTNDPVLRLIRGFTYIFDNSSNYVSHPFKIRTGINGTDFTSGVVDNNAGITTFTVPMDAPPELYYQCSVHTSMGNKVHILKEYSSTDDIPEGSSNLYYTDAKVDSHLNTSSATSGQVLSWTGSDYAWAANGSSGSTSVIAPVAFAVVNTTSDGSGTGISWGSWNSSNYTLDFTFDTAQSDTDYSVITDSETFDNYFVGISNKSTTGFRAEFYDDSQSREPSAFSPFTFIIYASTPTIDVTGGSSGSSPWTSGTNSLYYRSNVEVGTGNLFVDTTTSNVGIGSTTPSYTLDVNGDINFTGSIYQNGIEYGGGGGGSSYWLKDPDTLYYNTSNVGIGTTDASSELHVVGNVQATYFSGDGSALTNIQSSNVSDFSSNVTRIDNLTTDLSALTTDLSSNATRIDNLTTDLSSNATRIDNVIADLSSNASRIDNLTTDLSSNATRIDNLESSDLTIGGVKTFSSNLQVGTSNLFVDTTTSKIGIGTDTPLSTLDVRGDYAMGGHIIPSANDVYDIGSPEFKIRDLFVSNNSMWIGDRTKIAFENGKMKFKRRKVDKVPKVVRELAIANVENVTNEADVRTDALTYAQQRFPNDGITALADLQLQHWKAYTKSIDDTKEISDIFVDDDEDYEAQSAADAWNEIGSNIYSTHKMTIGSNVEPRATLDVKAADALIVPTGTTDERPASSVVGMLRYNSTTDYFETYTTGGWASIATPSSIVSISPRPATYADVTTEVITVTGSFFDPQTSVQLEGADGTLYDITNFTLVDSATFRFTIGTLVSGQLENRPYKIVVTNGAGLTTKSTTTLGFEMPTWSSPASGSIQMFTVNIPNTVTLSATDALGGSSISYSLVSGSLPGGVTLSGNTISGTSTESIGTTNTVTIRATDTGDASAYADLTFTIETNLSGEAVFTTVGTTYWTVPTNVTSVCVVAVGGGGSGLGSHSSDGAGGGGGGLGWKNNITVNPGSTYKVVVGNGGLASSTSSSSPDPGDVSYFINTSTVAGYGGTGGGNLDAGVSAGGSYTGDGGGSGGAGGAGGLWGGGGGGAGGYSGSGGSGATYPSSNSTSGNGGGGGGGYYGHGGGGGGGVGIYGEGTSGTNGTSSSLGGNGGSGGNNGANESSDLYGGGNGGAYGGGGGGGADGSRPNSSGAQGAVRIIWGAGRSFPSTNTSESTSYGFVSTY